MQPFAIGVDLGGTNLRVAAIEATGRNLETVDRKTATARDTVLDEMTSAIRCLVSRYKSTHEFLGIGVGIPGVVDLAGGVLRSAANLPGWNDYPVAQELAQRPSLARGRRYGR